MLTQQEEPRPTTTYRLAESLDVIEERMRKLIVEENSYDSDVTEVLITPTSIRIDDSLTLSSEQFWSHDLDLTIYSGHQLRHIISAIFNSCCPISQAPDFRRSLANYTENVARHYKDNPFHNFCHAVSVTHIAALFVREIEPDALTSLQQFGLLLSALVHDVNHPGHTNGFEILLRTELALKYNNESILEQHHAAVAFLLMRPAYSDVLIHFRDSDRRELRSLMVNCILATDMARHSELVSAASDRVSRARESSESSTEDQLLSCKLLLHASDVSNPIRPFKLAALWSRRICQEMNDQAAAEAELGFPVQPHMVVKSDVALAKNELFFATTFILPLWHNMSLLFPQLESVKDRLISNIGSWSELAKETAK
jgi:hypothetical protein